MGKSARIAITGVTAAAISYAAMKSYNKTASNQSQLELCQVQVVFRHGARTPLHVPSYIPTVTYETDLLKHPAQTIVPFRLVSLTRGELTESPFEQSYHKRGLLKGGCYPGQLTHVGARQMYEVGLFLKERYVDSLFLDPSQQKRFSEIYARSTNIQRTIESTRCVLAGLFSDGKCDKEFPICVCDPNQEIMYPNYYSCTHLAELTRFVWMDPDKLPGIKKIRQAVQKDLEISTAEKLDFVSVRDNLAAEEAHGKESKLMTKETKEAIEESAMKVMKGAFVGIHAVRPTSLQLAIGPFVDLILCKMEEKNLKDDSGVKLYMFSGHDTTLIPLLGALGICDNTWPPYAAHVVFELLRERPKADKEPKYYVRLLYNGEEKKVGDCSSTICPLEDFKKAVSHVRMPVDRYRKICLEDVGEDTQDLISRL